MVTADFPDFSETAIPDNVRISLEKCREQSKKIRIRTVTIVEIVDIVKFKA